jgi:sugar lactone lactonase YvrE
MPEGQAQLEHEIADLVRRSPGDWNEIHIHVCANVRTMGTTTGADVRLHKRPQRVTPQLEVLRETMADPQRGAWLMADITVPRRGSATFTYDWMSKPDWPGLGGDFDERAYLDDLAAFPRAAENIPEWYPDPDAVSPVPEYADAEPAQPPPPQPRRGNSDDMALTGLSFPFGTAVDASGSLYVTDTGNNRVILLTADGGPPVVLPFVDLWEPCGVGVDAAGTVYVADSLHDRILALPAGAGSAVEVPVPGLKYPGGIAVDGAGTLYVADRAHHRVLALPSGASTPDVLAFDGVRDPVDVAVDGADTVYVTDGTHHTDNPYSGRVLSLAAGHVVELVMGLQSPVGLAVDPAGDIYVATGIRGGEVIKLPGNSPNSPFTVAAGMHTPAGVALDGAGNIYIAEMPPGDDSDDQSRGRVVKVSVL